MNCQQCGAPLDWDGLRPVVVCEFCRSSQSVHVTTDSPDRIISLDRPGGSNCPRCHRQLTQAAMDGVKVECCEDCCGVLIEGEVFALLVRERRADFRGTSKPVPVDAKQLDVVVDCPSCQRAMEVHPYYGPGNVVIDSCSQCGLVWLDSGEIATIEAAPGAR